MKLPEIQKTVYSVSEITGEIKEILERGFSGVWVRGELSNLTRARSGHWYFTLKDDGAEISCVMFRGQNRYVEVPKNGAELLACGRLNVYPPRGRYQLVVDSLEDRGLGQMRERFEALKKQLTKEGLFDEKHKKTLPFLPRRIALVTSPEGAAVHDLIRVIKRRNPKVSLVVIPTLVQGETAAREIASSLRIAKELDGVDLIICGRGGGSMEDLWSFNEEVVARAIFESDIPIISAVGHETDFSIADFVADLRAATPSMAGEMAVPVLDELEQNLDNLQDRLARLMKHRINEARLEISKQNNRLVSPERKMVDYRLKFDALTNELTDAIKTRIYNEKEHLRELNGQLVSPEKKIADQKIRLNNLSAKLQFGLQNNALKTKNSMDMLALKLQKFDPTSDFDKMRSEFTNLSYRFFSTDPIHKNNQKERFDKLILQLNALSPLNVLKRGYSMVTTSENNVLTNAESVTKGDVLNIYPKNGKIKAEVVETGDSEFEVND